jgi:hypothetical protein
MSPNRLTVVGDTEISGDGAGAESWLGLGLGLGKEGESANTKPTIVTIRVNSARTATAAIT